MTYITSRATLSWRAIGGLLRHYALFVIAWAVIQAAVVTVRAPAALEGRLVDPDDYMRLVRVEQLHVTGDWYGAHNARSNAPYGQTSHWTRPLDVLLLGGAWVLAPFLGFERGLFWAGALIGPLLQLVLVLLVPWCTSPLLDPHARRLAVLAILAQPAVMSYAIAGRADHHMLLLLAFVVVVGLVLRVLVRPDATRLAVIAGIVSAAGMWVSVEFLLAVGMALGALGVLWVVRGGAWTERNVAFATGLAVGVVLCLAAERAPGGWSSVEYDRLSIVHVSVGTLALSYWALVMLMEAWHGALRSVGGRGLSAAIGAAAGAGAMDLLYPGFFGGPMAEVDPRIVALWLARVEEFQPLLMPVSLVGLGRFLAYLGATVVCVPFLGWVLAREGDDARWPGWLYVTAGFAVFVPVALQRARFATYAEILMAITMMALLGRLLRRIEHAPLRNWRVPIRIGATLGALVGFLAVGWVVQAAAGPRSGPGATTGAAPAPGMRSSCELPAISRYLADRQRLGREPKTVLAYLDYGSELLYRTPHAVIGTPYHRNAAGILDSHRIFTARDDHVARSIMAVRGIDLVLVCPRGVEAGVFRVPGAAPTLHRRLSEGDAPAWLEEIALPSELAAEFRLYRVVD